MLAVVCIVVGLLPGTVQYAGWQVLEVAGLTHKQVQSLTDDTVDVDVLHVKLHNLNLVTTTMLVPPHRLKDPMFTTYNTTVLNDDLDRSLLREKEANEAKRKKHPWTAKVGDDSFFAAFRPHDEHVALMRALSGMHTGVMKILPPIGRTVEGRDVLAGKLC